MKNFAPKFISSCFRAFAICCVLACYSQMVQAQCIGPQVTCSGPITLLTNNNSCQYCDSGLYNNLTPTPLPSPINLGFASRNAQFSNASLNGGGNYAVVQPGASVSLSFTMVVTMNLSTGYCPDCFVQTYIGLGGTSQTITCNAYGNDHYPGGTYVTADTSTFAAPSTPGLYYLCMNNTLDFSCVPQDFTNNPANAIGLIIVSPVPAVSDTCASITSITNDAPACFTPGTTTVNWTVTDALGSTASCQQQVMVNPSNNLSLSCPGNISVSNNAGVCGAVVNFNVSGVNCSSPVTITSTPAAGSLFPVGITTVNTTATDTFGNSTSCSFTVTVVDTTVHAITGTATVCGIQATLTAVGGTSYSWSGGSSPNSATNTFTSSGTYSVTISGDGCSATASQVVTVNPIPASITISGATTGCTSVSLTANSSSISGNVACSGYNTDVVADQPGVSTFNCTTNDVDQVGSGSVFVSQNYRFNGVNCASGNDGLPLSHQITSATTGITYTLQDYSANNDLKIYSGNTGALTLLAPVTTPTLYVVCMGGSGNATFVPTIYFTDNSSVTLPAVTVSDWCSAGANQLNGQIYFRLQRSSYSPCYYGGDCQHFFEIPINIPGGKPISSVSFTNNGSGILNIFALGQNVLGGGYTWSGGEIPNAATNTFLSSGTYTVTATTGSGCSVSAAATVTVDSTVISASGSTTICYGSSVTLTSTAGTTYQWSTGSTTQSITVNTGGVYSVTTNGCAAMNPTTVTVHQAPYITTNGPTTFCPGYSLQLTANPGGGTYLWSTGETTSTITVSTANTFSVAITDNFGCSLDTFVTTQVSALPVPALTSSTNLQFCPSYSPVVVQPATVSPLYAHYQWNDGTTVSSDNVTDSGYISVTVSDALGCSASASAVVVSDVVGDPTVFGQNAWNVYAYNTGDAQIDSNDWSKQYSGYYVDTNLSYNSTAYWCNTCSPSQAAGYLGCPTGTTNMSFSALRQGFPCGYYRIDVPGHDDAAQLFINGALAWVDSGCCDVNMNVWRGVLDASSQVVFRVSQGGGLVYGNTTFTLLPNDSIITSSAPLTFCPGYSIKLSGGNNANYLWSTGETTQTITVSTAGTFSLTVTDASGCSLSTADTVVTNVQPLPTPQIAGIYCFTIGNANLTLRNASPLYAAYHWSDLSSGSTDVAYDTGVVSVTVSDILGCSTTGSADIGSGVVGDPSVYGQGAWNVYAWNTGDATIDINDWSVNYTGYYVDTNLAFNTTKYWCTNSCSPSNAAGYMGCPVDPFDMSYSAKRQGFPCGYYRIDVPAHDDAAQLFINGALVWVDSACCDVNNNVWRGFLGPNTQVTFRVTQGGGGTDGITAFTLLPNDSIITSSAPLTFCPGYSINLSGGNNSTYLWSTGETTQSITVSTAGTFSLTATDTYGCGSVISTAVTSVQPLPAPVIGGGYCTVSGSARLVLVNPSPLYASYHWGDGSTTPYNIFPDTGEAYVTVTDILGCTASDSADIGSGIVGDPSVYGQGVWNVYAWNTGDAVIDANDWSTNYSGYYVDTNLAYNSTKYWCSSNCTPSQAPGYQGCPVNQSNISYSAQRQGFPCGYYRIDIPAHDDAAQLFIDGQLVWVDSGCCDVNNNVWRGMLDANTQIKFRITQGPGATDGIMAITALQGDSIVLASGPTSICTGGSVTLTAAGSTAYAWSTGATTQAITASAAGTYSVTISDGGACTVSSAASVNIILPVINGCSNDIAVANQPGVCGAVVTFNTPTAADLCSGANTLSFASINAYQMWTVPANVYSVHIDAAGATGAGGSGGPGGNGALVSTDLAVTPGEVLYINVGGAASGPDAGYNGGGIAAGGYYGNGGGGGGGTSVGTTGNYLTDTLVIAGGGGGGGDDCGDEPGGAGGGPNGTAGLNCGSPDGGGGTQTGGGTSTANPGQRWLGGTGVSVGYYYGSGAGGGGYYGGGGGTQGGGGGGSSYVTPGVTSNTTYYTGYNGNGGGYVNITYGTPFSAVQTAGPVSGSTFPVGTTQVTFTATDSAGGSSSCSFNVLVSDTEAPVITCPANINDSIQPGACGAKVNFNVGVTDNCGATVVSTPASGSIFPLGATTVTSVATDAAGNSSTCQFTVTLYPTPVAASASICDGSSYNFNGTLLTTAGLYTSTIPSSSGCDSTIYLTLTVNPSPATPVITAGGNTTICPGSRVKLTASAGTSYHWSTGATTQAIFAQASGNYIVTVYNASGCGAASAPTVVTSTSNPIPTVTVGGPTTFCQGGNVKLTASVGASYSWSNGATTRTITARASGTYTVTVALTGGCSGSSSPVTVTVNNLPGSSVSASGATTFCKGGSVTLTAITGVGYTYLWNTGQTTNSIAATATGSYRVTISNANGCKAASPVTRVIVRALPNATISTTSTELCNGDSIKLTAKPGVSWNWSTGATTRVITVRSAGTYDVTVTSTYNCSGISAPLPVTDCGSASKTDNSDNESTNTATPITLSNTFDVTVYPNPYTGQFHLKVLSSTTENINVKIFDITGKLLEERREMPYGTDVILGAGYAAGVYLIETAQADRVKMTRVVKAE